MTALEITTFLIWLHSSMHSELFSTFSWTFASCSVQRNTVIKDATAN